MLDGVPLDQLSIEGINDAPSLTVLAAVTFTTDLPPADTNPTGHRPVRTHWIPHRCSQSYSHWMRGGGVAFGHGMTFSNSRMSPTTTGHIQEGKRAGGRTTRHNRSSYHHCPHESFNDWGGRGYDDSVPGVVTKTALSGERTVFSI